MMIEDSTKLKETIKVLNELLGVGHSFKQCYFNEYQTQKVVEGFNTDTFAAKWELKLNNFINKEIIQSLVRHLGQDYHYIYHFQSPPVQPLSRAGWNTHINDIYNSFSAYIDALKEIIFRLEDQLVLAYKREIAKQEFDQNVLYRITYSAHSRRIKLNGIDLTKPDFETVPERLFAYIYERPNQVVSIADFEAEMKTSLGLRRPVQILADLGFKKELLAVFFPVRDKQQIKFVNPITNQYAVEHELPAISFNKLSDKVRQSTK